MAAKGARYKWQDGKIRIQIQANLRNGITKQISKGYKFPVVHTRKWKWYT